jgi:hypothetical protein
MGQVGLGWGRRSSRSDGSRINLCNFSGVPVAPRPLGPRRALPDRADPPGSTRRPQSQSTLVDITADSDGKVSGHHRHQRRQDTLALPDIKGGEPYYLIFLTGAYQDIMGDIHNLFGRVNGFTIFGLLGW